MLAELLIAASDSNSPNPLSHKAGDCIVVRRPGILIPPAAYMEWIDHDVLPPGWDTLDPESQKEALGHRRRILETRPFWGQPGAPAIFPTPNGPIVVPKTRYQGTEEAYQANLLFGYDTSWGTGDRQKFGVLKVDLSEQELRDIVRPLHGDIDEDGEPEILANREFQVPIDDPTVVSRRTREDWRDLGKVVDVTRQATPHDLSRLKLRQRSR